MLAAMTLFAALAAPATGQASGDIEQHIRAAELAESRDDFAGAVREFEAAVKQMPDSAELESNLGVARYFAGQTDSAIAALARAERLKPALFAPHLFLGLSRMRLSDPDAAVVELQKAVRINGSDAQAHTWLGYAYTAQSRFDLALHQLELAAELKPKDVDIWYAIGRCHLELGKQAIGKLLALAPDGGRAWQLAAEQYQLQGNTDKALQLYLGAFQRRPDIAGMRDQIVKLGGSVPAAVTNISRPHTEEDALYAQAHQNEEAARIAFTRVAEIDPGSYRAHQVQGDSLVAMERWKDAGQEYQVVAASRPDLPGIHEAIGECLLRQGQVAEALKQYRAELALQPHSASAQESVGRILVLMGDDDEARKALEAALALSHPPAETYKLLGKVEVRAQNYGRAEALLARYVALEKGDSNAYYLLSQAYRGLGNKAKMNEAVALYKKYSRDEQQRDSARRALDRLRGQDPAADATLNENTSQAAPQ
jgi:tetratricopeptide (TPR) repeat protein